MQLAWRTGTANDQPEAREGHGGVSAAESSAPREMASDEAAIIARAQTDPRAFAPLYQRYAPLILGYCRRQLGHQELAADATAQTFAKAIAALPRFALDPARPDSSVRRWLVTIAHNVVVDTQRRGRAHLSLEDESTATWLHETPFLTDPAPSPEEQLLSGEAAHRVQTMLARLPDRQRQIVELRLLGLNGVEIAEVVGLSHSAVKSAQFRAYGTLRDLFRQDESHPSYRPTRPENDDAQS